MPDTVASLVAQIRSLSSDAAKNPVAAAKAVKAIDALAQRLATAAAANRAASKKERRLTGCTRFVVVPGIPTVAATSTSQAVPFRFPSATKVTRIWAGLVGTIAPSNPQPLLSAFSVRVNVEGDKELVSDGTAGAFANLGALFVPVTSPAAGALSGPGVELGRDVKANEVWNFYFRNDGTLAALPTILLGCDDTAK